MPKGWIMVNPEKIGQCVHAAVLEPKALDNPGVPLFAYLCDYASYEYSDEMKKDFVLLCQKAWKNNGLSNEKQELLHISENDIFPITEVYDGKDTLNLPYGAAVVRGSEVLGDRTE